MQPNPVGALLFLATMLLAVVALAFGVLAFWLHKPPTSRPVKRPVKKRTTTKIDADR